MAKHDITPRQSKAIAGLLAARTLTDAAASAGVSLRTLQRWLDDAPFVAALSRAESQAIDIAVRRLAHLSGTAIDTLSSTMTDGEATPNAKVQAANVTLSQMSRLRELHDIETRVTKLEADRESAAKSR